MAEILIGQVMNVIDGQHFYMRVTHLGKNNRRKYNPEERIKIEKLAAPDQSISDKVLSKAELEIILQGHGVKCAIQTRDRYGCLTANVMLM